MFTDVSSFDGICIGRFVECVHPQGCAGLSKGCVHRPLWLDGVCVCVSVAVTGGVSGVH